MDIPGGSRHYIYDNGNTIGHWDYDEFAGVFIDVAVAISESFDEFCEFHEALEEEFGGVEPGARGDIRRPEKAEIFCRVVDRRTDATELTEEHVNRVKEYVEADGPYKR